MRSGGTDPGLRHQVLACYFFFIGELVAELFRAVVQDTSVSGDGTFLGCLGFLASRLPRCCPFAMMLLQLLRPRKRPPCYSFWARFPILSRSIFTSLQERGQTVRASEDARRTWRAMRCTDTRHGTACATAANRMNRVFAFFLLDYSHQRMVRHEAQESRLLLINGSLRQRYSLSSHSLTLRTLHHWS